MKTYLKKKYFNRKFVITVCFCWVLRMSKCQLKEETENPVFSPQPPISRLIPNSVLTLNGGEKAQSQSSQSTEDKDKDKSIPRLALFTTKRFNVKPPRWTHYEGNYNLYKYDYNSVPISKRKGIFTFYFPKRKTNIEKTKGYLLIASRKNPIVITKITLTTGSAKTLYRFNSIFEYSSQSYFVKPVRLKSQCQTLPKFLSETKVKVSSTEKAKYIITISNKCIFITQKGRIKTNTNPKVMNLNRLNEKNNKFLEIAFNTKDELFEVNEDKFESSSKLSKFQVAQSNQNLNWILIDSLITLKNHYPI